MIFLSYSNADVASALAIKAALEAGGVRCWKAPEDIRPGERWAAAITRAIRESTAMVIVVSERSMTSPEVAKELALAMSRRLLIIPLRIEDIELSDEWAYHFATIQWVDGFGGRLDAVCQRLIQDFGPVADTGTNELPAPTGLHALAPLPDDVPTSSPAPSVQHVEPEPAPAPEPVAESIDEPIAAPVAVPVQAPAPAAPPVPRELPAPIRIDTGVTDLAQMALPLPLAWWWEHMQAINDATVEKGEAAGPDSRTGRHQRLWTEMTAWLADLTRLVLGPERWDNKPNQFQIGKLSYTYWARLYPHDGRDFLGYDLHIGVQLSKHGPKWTTGIDTDVPASSPPQVVMALWASTNDRGLARMVNEASILDTYHWVQQETLLSNPSLHTGLIRDRRGHLMRASTYLSKLERWNDDERPTGCCLWSPLITLDDVRRDPARVSLLVAEYVRILAEPVRVARAMVVPPADESATTSRTHGATPAPAAPQASAGPPPALRTFAEQLATDGRATLTIRELLGWFGSQRRGSQVLQRVLNALEMMIAEGHDALAPLRDRVATADIDETVHLSAVRPPVTIAHTPEMQ
jgi:hypothetical protein